MSHRRLDFSKIAAIIGGFLILAGIIFLGVAVLAFLGYLNVGMLLENKYLLMFAIALASAGLLDIITAVVIARW